MLNKMSVLLSLLLVAVVAAQNNCLMQLQSVQTTVQGNNALGSSMLSAKTESLPWALLTQLLLEGQQCDQPLSC